MIVCPASLFVSWFIARQSHRLVSTIGWENVGFEMTVVTEWDCNLRSEHGEHRLGFTQFTQWGLSKDKL